MSTVAAFEGDNFFLNNGENIIEMLFRYGIVIR